MESPKKSQFFISEVCEGGYARTDLACESAASALDSEKENIVIGTAAVTVTRHRGGAGEPSFATLACGRITERGEEEIPLLSELLAKELRRMAAFMVGREVDSSWRVLVAGLGNAHMTPDAVGPGTVSRLTVTRHLRAHDEALFGALGCCELSALAPGVLGQTGMESGELVRAAAELTRPDLLVVVDALAARSCERLASTIQLSDGGISPGAGIGNHRMAINRETMGCPVMGVGVPTVVDSSTLVWDALERAGMTQECLPSELIAVLESGRSFIVTPRDCDEMEELTCRLLAEALDRAFGVGG